MSIILGLNEDSRDWIDSTNSVIGNCDAVDPWNHPLLEDEVYPSSAKRVSLDASETWMTDDTFEFMDFDNEVESAIPPATISFLPESSLPSWTDTALDGDAVMADEGSTDPKSSFPFSQQFQERRAQLAASMEASKKSRQCLLVQEHVRTRANLKQVLADIEKSSKIVQKHCLQTVEKQEMDSATKQRETSASK